MSLTSPDTMSAAPSLTEAIDEIVANADARRGVTPAEVIDALADFELAPDTDPSFFDLTPGVDIGVREFQQFQALCQPPANQK